MRASKVTLRASGWAVILMGCFAAASATGFGTIMAAGSIFMGLLFLREAKRPEYD